MEPVERLLNSCQGLFKVVNIYIWMFPKMMVPPNHPFLIGFSIINHPFWVPLFLETSIYNIIPFHFRVYLRIAEMLRDTLHSTHAFVRHLRRLRLLESGFSLLPNDPNQQWPMDPWLIGLIRKLLNRGHLLRLLIIHDAKSRNYCRITWAGFLSWLLHRVFTLCSGPLNFRVSWHHEVPARCISRSCDPWKAADGGALASTCRHKWLCQCCISPISVLSKKYKHLSDRSEYFQCQNVFDQNKVHIFHQKHVIAL